MKAEARWPRGVAPVRTFVRCQGAEPHTITWRRGRLVLEDHDLAADRVVVALGGARPPCLDIHRSWQLGYLEGAPVLQPLSSLARWMAVVGDGPVALPESLRRLREASVLHTWGRGLRAADGTGDAQRAFFERAITSKVRDLLRRSLRPLGAHRDAELDVQVGPEVEAEGRVEGTRAWARVRVPSSWLSGVWVSELETWRGDIVLAAGDRVPTWLDVARWDDDGELVVARVRP